MKKTINQINIFSKTVKINVKIAKNTINIVLGLNLKKLRNWKLFFYQVFYLVTMYQRNILFVKDF